MRARIRTIAVVVAGILAACSGPAMQASPPAQLSSHGLWQRTLRRLPLPGAGCYKASYPSMAWSRIACSTERLRPAFSPHIVPNGDYAATVAPNVISSVTGSFPAVSGVTRVRSTHAGPSTGPNSYSLQINTQFFSTAACGKIAHCMGWVQFVYRNQPKKRPANLEIWDWLVSSSAAPLWRCPPNAGWHPSNATGAAGDCYQTNRVLSVPNQPIAALAQMSLTGAAASSGDTIELTAGDTVYAGKAQRDGIVDLSSNWNLAEFNVFGYSTAGSVPSSAIFNRGSAVTVSLEIDDGAQTAPKCLGKYSTTFELNNLTLGAPPSDPPALANPSILFSESNPGKGARSCVSQAGSG